MLPRKLSLLQSRLLTNLLTTCLLVAVWPSSHAQCLTYAAELPTALDRDQQLAPVPKVLAYVHDDRVDDEGNAGYAPGFDYFDRSIVGRQEPQLQKLVDGEKRVVNINPGETVHFILKRGRSRVRRGDDDAIHVLDAYDPHNASGTLANGELAVEQEEGVGDDNAPNEVKKRQAGNSIWISANTCKQPVASRKDVSKPHQQLVMYVSASAKNQQPGPGTETSPVLFEKGFANVSLQANSDVYVGISAPTLDPEWFGSWDFELAASSNGSYHSYNDTNPFLFMVDTDSESALFITYNLSDAQSNKSDAVAKWNQSNPMRMYAFPAGDNATIAGLEHSFCAVRDLFANSGMRSNTSITTKFGGDLPKSQFHISGLASNQTYNGFLIVEGNDKQALELPGVGTVRGGGKVFQQFNWTTKKDDSCQVLFDLTFCDSVAYAVPSNKSFKTNDAALKALYDDNARSYYDNFNKSLAQVACDTTSQSQYSLARTCTDCANDYKRWLCSVLIPRCEDWSANNDGSQPWLQPRNVNAPLTDGSPTFGGNVSKAFNESTRDRFAFSKSRNPMIDEKIQPGPYLEMKPCEDLCFDIVRSCPAQLGFACPNAAARVISYGKRDPKENELKCNFPGAVVKLNVQGAAETLKVCFASTVLSALLVAVVSLV